MLQENRQRVQSKFQNLHQSLATAVHRGTESQAQTPKDDKQRISRELSDPAQTEQGPPVVPAGRKSQNNLENNDVNMGKPSQGSVRPS